MATVNDPAYSTGTRDHLMEADAVLGRLVVATREQDDDAEAARIAQQVGDIVIECTAALCSALADVAAALRERPS